MTLHITDLFPEAALVLGRFPIEVICQLRLRLFEKVRTRPMDDYVPQVGVKPCDIRGSAAN